MHLLLGEQEQERCRTNEPELKQHGEQYAACHWTERDLLADVVRVIGEPVKRTDRIALRGALGVIVLVCTSLLAIVLVGDAELRGTWLIAVRGVVACAGIVWFEWWMLASPALLVTGV